MNHYKTILDTNNLVIWYKVLILKKSLKGSN